MAYDGTAYAGWQIQRDVPTVQGVVLAAARTLLGDSVRLVGASRTDAGVHALRQVASLATGSALAAATVGRALNATLPPDIRVRAVADAAGDFDARRRATGKRYAYLVDAGSVAAPLLRRYAWHVPRPLDLGAMREALAPVRGAHDFSAFCAAAGRDAMPVCHVRAIHVLRRKSRVVIVISADRFLHHMVRTLVGSAVAVGRGAREPAWIAEVLKSRDRRLAGATAPAHGLTLVRVLY
ncbi:MAG TPA: tRNA pseudouridine(38-40) synthase TruA [Methylomirabilota bacterium]|nr:tRNA pseudouridine(38-40) synthase TruA [Methylomirabilota bacterium]